MEFYITNSCNLNCEGCNAISNFNIPANHQLWEDHKETYRKWADLLDIAEISILGGEPLANSDWKNWVIGIRQLWPNAIIYFVTNGLLITKKANTVLYKLCQENNIQVSVSLHNKHTADFVKTIVFNWLVHPKIKDIEIHHESMQNSYNAIKDPSWPDCDTIADWNALPEAIRNECVNVHNFTFIEIPPQVTIIDQNGVTVSLNEQWDFFPGPVSKLSNKFMFNSSDPVQAHLSCHQKTCHQLYQGKLHKCAPSHVFKDIVDNFDTNLNQADLALIHNYRPATVDMNMFEIENFINNLNNPIEQCKFCPTSTTKKMIFAETSKKQLLMLRK
jgi:organic radical activating enzyme